MRLTRMILESTPQHAPVREALDAIGEQRWLDPVVGPLQRVVRGVPLGGVRDVVRGTWLGHPLHPALVQVPIGSWTSAAVLDLMPGQKRAATAMVALGLAGAVPAAVAGWVDWAELRPRQMRVGVVHAAANATGVALYTASLVARLRGRPAAGRALGFAGLTVATVGGVLGGHLAFRQAAGVNHAEDVPHVAEPVWHWLGELTDFPLGQVQHRMAGEVPVLVLRESDSEVHVLADRCSHLSGPLSQGKVEDGCVECPWHGSVFRLTDGTVMQGPATSPQPVFETRTVGGRVQVHPPADS